jgi:hypothetical protein
MEFADIADGRRSRGGRPNVLRITVLNRRTLRNPAPSATCDRGKPESVVNCLARKTLCACNTSTGEAPMCLLKSRRWSGEASARCPTREQPRVLRRTFGELFQIDPVRFRGRVAFCVAGPANMNDEGLADAAAANPFRLPRRHPKKRSSGGGPCIPRCRPEAGAAAADRWWGGPHGAEHHSFTGVRTGAPLAFRSTTTNLAGFVSLALRPTTWTSVEPS